LIPTLLRLRCLKYPASQDISDGALVIPCDASVYARARIHYTHGDEAAYLCAIMLDGHGASVARRDFGYGLIVCNNEVIVNYYRVFEGFCFGPLKSVNERCRSCDATLNDLRVVYNSRFSLLRSLRSQSGEASVPAKQVSQLR